MSFGTYGHKNLLIQPLRIVTSRWHNRNAIGLYHDYVSNADAPFLVKCLHFMVPIRLSARSPLRRPPY